VTDKVLLPTWPTVSLPAAGRADGALALEAQVAELQAVALQEPGGTPLSTSATMLDVEARSARAGRPDAHGGE
jgi:hypothetical protein